MLRFYAAQNIFFLFRHAQAKVDIIEDIRKWQRIIPSLPQSEIPQQVLFTLFNRLPEFRNLFFFRLKNDPVRKSLIYDLTSRLFFPPKTDLVIRAVESIGPGLFIQHGRSTGLAVQRMGAECWVNQHVSIGFKGRNSRPPVIGDKVQVKDGAKIFGDITVGDNAIIGANAVVLKNVPPNCTVVGVPGRIVKRDGKRVDEPLTN